MNPKRTFVMSGLFAACAFTLLGALDVYSHAQGTIAFNNRVRPGVDARVTLLDGTPVGADYTAQLYGGREGTAVDSLIPFFPTAQFRTTSTAAMGYVQGAVIE